MLRSVLLLAAACLHLTGYITGKQRIGHGPIIADRAALILCLCCATFVLHGNTYFILADAHLLSSNGLRTQAILNRGGRARDAMATGAPLRLRGGGKGTGLSSVVTAPVLSVCWPCLRDVMNGRVFFRGRHRL
jgi:hypothetical protein